MKWKFWKRCRDIRNKIVETLPVESRPKFPCSDKTCLVRVSCTKACDKIEMDDEKLRDLFLKYNACPDCGSKEFMEGPSGGMSTNIKCHGCGHWFNAMLPLSIERIHINEGRFYN